MNPVKPAPYNPLFGDEKECADPDCGHSYYRHFDSYEEMEPVGCKYCHCRSFVVTGGRLNDLGELELFLPFDSHGSNPSIPQ
jgi:hypothetical protein